MDQFIEMTINRSSKETGFLAGKTENPGACARWTKINHFLVALKEHQNKILRKNRNERHIEVGEKRILKDESEVQMLLQMLEILVPNLWEDNEPLINISTGEKANTDFIENFKKRYDRGTVGMNEFFKRIKEKIEKERTIPEKSYYEPIKKQKLVIFGSNQKEKKLLSTTEDENESCGEISRFDNKKLDLRMIMNWPVTTKPYSISGENEKNTLQL